MDKLKKPIKGWIRVLLIIIPFVIIVGFFQVFAGMLLGLKKSGSHEALTTFQSLVLSLSMLAGTFTVVGIFRRWIDKESFQSLGFGMKNFRREAETGFWLGLVMIATGFLLLVLLHEITWTGINPDSLSIFLSMLLFISVGFTEELFFRGYILGNLMLSMNRWVALLLSSVVFSLAHIGNAHFSLLGFTTIILAGLLLGLPYIFTKSLWLPISLHFSWNFFQGTIFGFSVSGNTEYALVTQTRNADSIWNGGSFGFEGSILAILFLALAIVALTIRYNKKENRVPLPVPPLIQVIQDQPETTTES